jgi:hypothetical protein
VIRAPTFRFVTQHPYVQVGTSRSRKALRAGGVVAALGGVLSLCTGLVMSASATPGVPVNPVWPVSLLDQNGNGLWPGPGNGPATIRLTPGQNVLNLTVAQLASLQNLNLAPGSSRAKPPRAPSCGTWPRRAR